jgi:hypothetical protein
MHGGPSPGSGDWTLTLTSGSVLSTAGDETVLSQDAAGIIHLSDGSEITFQGIERIAW